MHAMWTLELLGFVERQVPSTVTCWENMKCATSTRNTLKLFQYLIIIVDTGAYLSRVDAKDKENKPLELEAEHEFHNPFLM